MALADTFAALEDHLAAAFDAGDDVAEESGMFAIVDLEKADWAIRKVAKARRKLAEAEQVADAEIGRIRGWLDGEQRRFEQDTSFLVSLLEGFHRHVLDADPKAKTLRLPAGELVARKTPDKLTVEDDFITWAKANDHADLVRVVESADLPAAKRVLGMNAEDPDDIGRVRAVDPKTGEPVPGCWWLPGDVRFSVVTSEEVAS